MTSVSGHKVSVMVFLLQEQEPDQRGACFPPQGDERDTAREKEKTCVRNEAQMYPSMRQITHSLVVNMKS